MRVLRRTVITSLSAAALLGAGAAPSLAHECVNASKQDQAAGVQVIMDLSTSEGGIEWVSQGLERRIDNGLVNPETGEGFHGLMGFDLDGDGSADVSTWIVGPEGEIPTVAQTSGAPCNGVVNLEDYFGCMSS
ncbi:MAG TPA: hypothetical protein VF049_17860 [Nocardioidaceae bacterium]|jgi:hypothetical protein